MKETFSSIRQNIGLNHGEGSFDSLLTSISRNVQIVHKRVAPSKNNMMPANPAIGEVTANRMNKNKTSVQIAFFMTAYFLISAVKLTN
jgi:hypothetical protein